VALPFLDAMTPALGAVNQAARKPVTRLAFIYVPNGVIHDQWRPTGGGRDFEWSPTLRSLAGLREHVTVVSGLAHLEANGIGDGNGDHSRASTVWLTGAHGKRTEGPDVLAGTSADQHAAQTIGQGTALPSLELALERTEQMVGNCDVGYSCVYQNTICWRNPTTPIPMEVHPRVVFERLFGDGGSVTARMAEMRRDRSILDNVADSMRRLERRLGVGDQRTVGEYLDAVREIERRIQRAEQNNATTPLPSLEQPTGVPDGYEEHVRLLIELLALAYQADATRVSCMQLARESSGRTYPHIGVPEGHHPVSHHQNDAHNIQQNTKINTYHMSLFAGFVEKLRNTQDGDGTLLDHTMLLYGAGMGDGDQHTPIDMPVVLAGGGCGRLIGGQHVKYPLNTPFMNLGLTLLAKMDVQVDKVGDSTGLLSGL
jgi:hypothetical protein